MVEKFEFCIKCSVSFFCIGIEEGLFSKSPPYIQAIEKIKT